MKQRISLVIVALLIVSMVLPVDAAPVSIEGTTQGIVTSVGVSTWNVTLPNIEINQETGLASGDITVTGDLAPDKQLVVKPDKEVTLTQIGRRKVIADVTSTNVLWSSDELSETPSTSTIEFKTRTKFKNGTYKGSLNVLVKVLTVPTKQEVFTKHNVVYNDGYMLLDLYHEKAPLKAKYGTASYFATTQVVWGCHDWKGYNPSYTNWMNYGYYTGNMMLSLWKDNKVYANTDILIIAAGQEVTNGSAQAKAITCDFRGGDKDVGSVYLQSINYIRKAHKARNLHVPVVYVNQYVQQTPETPTVGATALNAMWDDPRIAAANETANIVFIDARKILTPKEVDRYAIGGITDSGKLKLNNAIEEGIYQWYVDNPPEIW